MEPEQPEPPEIDTTTAQAAPREIMPLALRVPPECDGWRLDHFLKQRIRRLSRTKICTIIASQVWLSNGRQPRPAMSVHAGDTIHIDRPAPIEPEVPREFGILAEDEYFLAIDKPAGLPMHTTAKFWKNTLVAILRERYPAEPLQICHRIDRETSGVLLVARNREAASFLKRAFASRSVKKTYLALVHGIPEPPSGVIDAPMRLIESKSHLMMGIKSDGLPAVTRYVVQKTFAQHALVEASPETGRQHQIRVHLAHIGHPIVGDKLYGAGEQSFLDYCDSGLTPALLDLFNGLPRHALHAARLVFPHPQSKEMIAVESPLPDDLCEYMKGL
ncbi:MAG TPA: RluA family pseudouridine synthase [Polyangia bacterium]